MTKKLVTIGAAVIVTLLALALVWQLRQAVVYVLISLALAAAVRPLFTAWARRRWRQRAGLVGLCLVVVAGVGFLLLTGSNAAVREVQQLAANTSAQDAWQMPQWLQGSAFQQSLAGRLPSPSLVFRSITGEQGQLVLPALLGFSHGMVEVVAGVLLVLFLSAYWSVHQTHFERLWLSLLPPARRKQVRDIWRTIEPEIGAYIRSEIFQCLLTGVILGLGYWALGSPYPALLALAGAVACLIPVVGAALAVMLVLVVGLLTSVPLSLLTAAVTALVFIGLGLWVKPLLFTRVQNNPFLTVAILIVLAQAFGLPGLIVAPPLSTVCQVLWSHLISQKALVGAAAQVSDLKDRQERLRDNIQAMDQPPQALVTSSMQRLALLIEKSEPILQVAVSIDPGD
jgi:predicted PurR-regulated permease PerM